MLIVLAAATVLVVALGDWFGLLRRNRGPQLPPAEAAPAQEEILAQAGERGWRVLQGHEASRERFPEAVRPDQVRPRGCDLVVVGDGWRASSWSATARSDQTGVTTLRLHVVCVPGVSRGLRVTAGIVPGPFEPHLEPAGFSGELRSHLGALMLAGGQTEVLRPTPVRELLVRLRAKRGWMVVEGGSAYVITFSEPEPDLLHRRVDLARSFADLLG